VDPNFYCKVRGWEEGADQIVLQSEKYLIPFFYSLFIFKRRKAAAAALLPALSVNLPLPSEIEEGENELSPRDWQVLLAGYTSPLKNVHSSSSFYFQGPKLANIKRKNRL